MPPSASANAKRKQDEKHYNILKELLSQDCNKKCFDCGQRGPVYVNMTIGAFVCTTCSGLLRGMNTPHRVKSVSMASFTPEEMEFIQKRGNDACYCVWMGRYEAKYGTDAFPESKDEHKLREYMYKKYEAKMWFVSEAKALAEYEELRRKNQSKDAATAATATATTKPSIPVPKSNSSHNLGSKVTSSSGSSITSKPPAPTSKPVVSLGSKPTQQQKTTAASFSDNQNQLDKIFGTGPTSPAAVASKPPPQANVAMKSPSAATTAVPFQSNDPFASSSSPPQGNNSDLDWFSFPPNQPQSGLTTTQGQNSGPIPTLLPSGLSRVVNEVSNPDASSQLSSGMGQMSLNPMPFTTSTIPPKAGTTSAASTITTAAVNSNSMSAKEDKYAILASLDEELKVGSNKLSWSDTLTTTNVGGGIGSNNSMYNSSNSANGSFGSAAPTSMSNFGSQWNNQPRSTNGMFSSGTVDYQLNHQQQQQQHHPNMYYNQSGGGNLGAPNANPFISGGISANYQQQPPSNFANPFMDPKFTSSQNTNMAGDYYHQMPSNTGGCVSAFSSNQSHNSGFPNATFSTNAPSFNVFSANTPFSGAQQFQMATGNNSMFPNSSQNQFHPFASTQTPTAVTMQSSNFNGFPANPMSNNPNSSNPPNPWSGFNQSVNNSSSSSSSIPIQQSHPFTSSFIPNAASSTTAAYTAATPQVDPFASLSINSMLKSSSVNANGPAQSQQQQQQHPFNMNNGSANHTTTFLFPANDEGGFTSAASNGLTRGGVGTGTRTGTMKANPFMD